MAKRTFNLFDVANNSKKAGTKFRKDNTELCIVAITVTMEGVDEDGDEAEFEGSYLMAFDPSTKAGTAKKKATSLIQEDVGDDYSSINIDAWEVEHMPEEEEEAPAPKAKAKGKGKKKASAKKQSSSKGSKKGSKKKVAKTDEEEPAPKAKKPKKGTKASGKGKGKANKKTAKPKTSTPAEVMKALRGHIKGMSPVDAYEMVMITENWNTLEGLKVTPQLATKVANSAPYAKLLRRIVVVVLADVVGSVTGIRAKTPAKKLAAALYELLDRVYMTTEAEEEVDLDELIEGLNSLVSTSELTDGEDPEDEEDDEPESEDDESEDEEDDDDSEDEDDEDLDDDEDDEDEDELDDDEE